jgi:PAS domain S-box-containing protein
MSMLSPPLIEKLLILEDVPADAELEERALLDAGHSFQARRVDTRADFLEALDSFCPDLVIVDYNVPDLDGLSAIRLIRERDAELPILLVTGYLEDEAAVAVIKAGATDFVRKDRLTRLPIAAANALAAAGAQRDRREAVRAMQQSARDFEDLYNNAPCGYHSVDRALTIVAINDTELGWLGYRRDEVVGKIRIVDLLTADSAAKVVQQALPRLLAVGEVRDMEVELVRKDGTRLPAMLASTSIIDPDGSYAGSRTTVHDMSRLKAVE